MKWVVIHDFIDVNEIKLTVVSEHMSLDEAVSISNELNEYVSSFEVYYVREII